MVSLPHFLESVYVLKDEYQQGLDKVQTYGKVSRDSILHDGDTDLVTLMAKNLISGQVETERL